MTQLSEIDFYFHFFKHASVCQWANRLSPGCCTMFWILPNEGKYTRQDNPTAVFQPPVLSQTAMKATGSGNTRRPYLCQANDLMLFLCVFFFLLAADESGGSPNNILIITWGDLFFFFLFTSEAAAGFCCIRFPVALADTRGGGGGEVTCASARTLSTQPPCAPW